MVASTRSTPRPRRDRRRGAARPNPAWRHVGRPMVISAVPGRRRNIHQLPLPGRGQGLAWRYRQHCPFIIHVLGGAGAAPGAVAGKQRQVGFVSAFVLGTPLLAGFFVVGSGLIDSELFQGHTDGTLAFAIFVGALIAVSAFPVMVRILQEMGLDATATAHVGISAAAVVTIGMFLISATAITISASTTPVVDLALKYALVASYLTVFIGLLPKLLHPFTQRCLAAGQLTPELFAVAFVVLFASGVIADRLGISVIVGGFVAGLALPERERLNSELSPQLQPLVSIVLLPIFLAFSGLNTDFRQLTSSALFGLVVFLIASVVAKLGAGAVGARFAGLTWKEGALLGTLMNCRGLLVLVVALDGVNAGLISPAMQVCTVVAALVTTGMTGPLVRRFGESHPAETDGLAVSRVE